VNNGVVNPAYVRDASGFTGWADDVKIPANEEELSAVLREASARGIPVTAIGAGSGLTGGRVARGGWVVSTEKFRRLEIKQGSARVGAAVTLLDIRDAAAPRGQFYAPDPTEITASIGGTIATNASGSRSFRFGATRRHILSLRVAFVDGSIAEFRRGGKIDFDVPHIALPDVRKTTAGYRLQPGMDWIDLICGSEGTLAIVFEVEIALLPLPAHLFAGVVFFGSDDAALDAVDAWRRVNDLRMLEYVGASALDLLRGRYPEIPAEAKAGLLIEGEHIEGWDEQLESAGALLDASWFSESARDRERFRRFRHSLPELVIETVSKRGFQKKGTDYAVPVARNREMLAYYRQRLDAEMPGQYVLYGHIGDAHVHANMLPATERQAQAASALMTEFARKAVELGGTVSAEHGLGKSKAHLLPLQFQVEDIEAMKAVKRRLDPQWLLGRDTLFPSPQV
jgi:FAD/FMN-containing dehydrogenase